MTYDERPEYSPNASSAQELFSNIPAELRQYPQWVCHKNKEPIDPKTGFAASPTNPAHWATYDEAVAAASRFDGIGFVLTEADPYTIIDLDDAGNDNEIYQRQVRVFEQFNSYTELSPSGRGIHIIVKGRTPCGRRRDKIELYPHARYMTMTGNVIRNVGIAERQELLDILFEQMGGSSSGVAGLQADRDATLDDATVAALLCRDPALAALYSGDLSAKGGNHSSADQALCNALAARSGNRAQVERIWMASPMANLPGRHVKMARADYRQRTIEEAFDRPEADPLNVGNFTVNGKAFFSDAPAPGDKPTFIDAADLASRPTSPRRNIWAENVPLAQTTMLYSPGGAGKSLFGQQLCTSVATGAHMLGVQTMICRALYITCEDDLDELHRRQHDICKALGVDLKDFRDRFWLVALTGQTNNELAVFDNLGRMAATPRYAELKATIEATRAELVFLDNVAHLFSGNENARNQVAAFLGLLNKLASETGAAIILVAHTNKAGDGSGSTAWLNQVRTALKLVIPADERGFVPDVNARRLTRVKSNYARAGEAVDFRWHRGAFVRAEDLPADVAEAVLSHARDDEDERVFLACLAERTRQRRAVSEKVSKTYAPTIFDKMTESNKVGKARLEAAMDRLFAKGAIERGFLWRDTTEGKDRFGLREAPANGPANDPPTRSANDRQPTPLTPPTDPPTHPYTTYMDGGAFEGPPPSEEEGSEPMDD